MSNTKRIVSIVMALALMINIFAVVVTAAEPVADTADYLVDVTLSADKTQVYPGQTVTVTMTVGTNCYLGGLTLPVYFSNSVFETEGNVTLLGSFANYASITAGVPVSDAIVWPKKMDGATVNTSLKKSYGACMINAYADKNVGSTTAVLDPAEATITLEFTVAEDAVVGSTGVILLEETALKTTSATTMPMTAYAYTTSEISFAADAIVSMLNMTVGSKLEFEVIDIPEADPADFSGLEAALTECAVDDSSASNYLTSTWAAYATARQAAQECFENAATYTVEDQDYIDGLEAQLREAFANLEPVATEADYTPINEALEKVPSEYDLKFCTEDSVAALQYAIDNINWNYAPSEQDRIDAYAEVILNMIDALEPDESRAAAEAKIVFDKYEGEAGETVNVSVHLGTNYYVESLSIPVFFDNTYFELVADSVSFENSTLAQSGWINYNLNPGDTIYTRTDPNDTTWASIWANEANRSRYEALLFTWVQDGSSTNATSLEADIDEAFVTFQLKVKDNAPDGDAKVFLCESFIKDAAYMGGIFFVTRDLDDSTLNVSATQPVGQTYVLSEAEATFVIGAEPVLEDPTLVASEGSTTVIDTTISGTYTINGVDTEIKGVVYGLAPDLWDIDAYVEATNEGTVVVTPVDGNYAVGTGALIEVIRDGVVYENYVVIIFGDVNGDATIDIYDASDIDNYAAGMGDELSDFVYRAADLEPDGSVDIFDASYFEAYAAGFGDIDQVSGLFVE